MLQILYLKQIQLTGTGSWEKMQVVRGEQLP